MPSAHLKLASQSTWAEPFYSFLFQRTWFVGFLFQSIKKREIKWNWKKNSRTHSQVDHIHMVYYKAGFFTSVEPRKNVPF